MVNKNDHFEINNCLSSEQQVVHNTHSLKKFKKKRRTRRKKKKEEKQNKTVHPNLNQQPSYYYSTTLLPIYLHYVHRQLSYQQYRASTASSIFSLWKWFSAMSWEEGVWISAGIAHCSWLTIVRIIELLHTNLVCCITTIFTITWN